MTARPLAGRTALVAGGSSGIGAATAVALAREGADVAIAARRAVELTEVADAVRAHGARALTVLADFAADDGVASCVETVRDRLGPIDLLIYSAAAVRLGAVHETALRHWDLMLRLNLTAPFLLVRELMPSMLERGHGWMVMIGSAAGLEAVPGTGGYGVTKAALHQLTELVAEEGRDHGVRAAAICPGWVRTGLAADPASQGVPETDVLTAEDVADTVAWLVTRPARMNVGPLIPVAPVASRADANRGLTRYAFAAAVPSAAASGQR
ncbi:MAG TPA: SDR family oxidoreductase [Actinocrinis sp.]|uniref:SDR family oxidoreductase n=1 Tax=Actinocrinis sp. TaxID=1920516 RepID=UPI002DDCED68|nr:SDR family oxidoreductase [Actinocrinis sp.]HEV3170466.1 SDR family oxidoreductase [Actinocrinis sp.]